MNRLHITVGFLAAVAVLIYIMAMNKIKLETEETPAQELPTRFDSGVVHDNGWAVVPREESGETVYWFLAPDEDGVTPAVFKKTIHDGKSEVKVTVTSDCEAPKATCDRLMKQFESISAQYK